MLKKIFVYTISILLVIIMTACNNQNNKEENNISSLCNQLENDIKSYQNNEIDREELYSKLDNYQYECINSTTDVCITLNAVISIPKERENIRELFIKDLLNHCNKK